MAPPLDRTRARREILGRHPTEAEGLAHSVDRLVDARSPPTFLAHAADDPIAPVEATLAAFAALRAAGVGAELHVFQVGGHGWGMGRPGTAPAAWPDLFAAWAGLARP
jgi:acetyl esterase/lipase